MSLLDDTLAFLHQSPLRERAVLRGSLLTATWIPQRGVNDLDFLLDGPSTTPEVLGFLEQLFAPFSGVRASFEVIWAETDFPGTRATLERAEETLQVDVGWGEQLAMPPRETTVRGRNWKAVAPEVMFGWKVHSLVEHGERGRWHAKTLADLVLFLRHLELDSQRARAAVEASFASQRMPLSRLDGFFDDPTWGRSRGSRNKWKSYSKRSPWVTFTLEEALATVRPALVRLLRTVPIALEPRLT